MRTRIALAAVVAVAVVITTTVLQPAPAESVRPSPHARPRRSAPVALRGQQLVAFVRVITAGRAAIPPLDELTPLFLPAHPFTPPAPPVIAQALPTAGPPDTVTPVERTAWERVALCEEAGDWHAENAAFSGGLGIRRSNWAAYGGLAYAPEAAMATEDQQIMVAERIQSSPPDQYGCRGW